MYYNEDISIPWTNLGPPKALNFLSPAKETIGKEDRTVPVLN
jgi:hypothetical protein